MPSAPESTSRQRRYIYNNDGTNILANTLHGRRPLLPDDVRAYVDLIAGTPITSFFICANSSLPYYPSRHDRSMGCLAEGQADGSGELPNRNENCRVYGESIRSLRTHGTDMIALCVERSHALGLEAFATMRMNDLHHHNTAVHYPMGQGDFWQSHPEYRVGPHPGWHADGALDYTHEAVRRYRLGMIAELCEGYDLDGLELDFIRFPVFFPANTGASRHGLMTEFVREARAIARRVGAHRGRPLLLVARVPSDLQHCRWAGLDPAAWASEGLVDFLTASCIFHDYPLAFAAFRSALGADYRLPLYAAIEDGIGRPNGREFRSHAMFRGAAAHLHAQGADGIYLFNFFLDRRQTFAYLGPEQGDLPGLAKTRIGPDRALLGELDRPEGLVGRTTHHPLPVDHDVFGYQYTFGLPVGFGADGCVALSADLPADVTAHPPLAAVLVTRATGEVSPSFAVNGDHLDPLPDDAPEGVCCLDGPIAAWGPDAPPPSRRWRIPVASLRQGPNAVRAHGAVGTTLQQVDVVLVHRAALE